MGGVTTYSVSVCHDENEDFSTQMVRVEAVYLAYIEKDKGHFFALAILMVCNTVYK